MIRHFDSPAEARAWARDQKQAGRSLGFVPTMGALHVGHLSLAQQALAENDVVCVSVFVNPLQFDEAQDLAAYPRDLDGDVRALDQIGCQMVFTGTLEEFFEGELDEDGRLPAEFRQKAGKGGQGLEGGVRDGHFDGVATIVDRLFEYVRPDRAYFGQKDFQQCLVVRDVAKRRGAPTVVVCPTDREPGGLARSSRNQRLNEEQRAQGRSLSSALRRCTEAWQAGERIPARLEQVLRKEFAAWGVECDYAGVRDPQDWTAETPEGPLTEAVALVAARLGPVRLLDNHLLCEPLPRAILDGIPSEERS
ncbi:MAG: pantoate--beta-alanine ligase [Candidatus Paceibacteria bacterium]